jgi:hypothetical protein
MNRDEIIAKINEVESHLPKTYDELIMQIDRFIFGAQKGFDLCTELLLSDFNEQAKASVEYKKALARLILDAEMMKVAASCRKEWAIARMVVEDSEMTLAESNVMITRFMRDRYLERLNSFKRIKGDSVMQRTSV